MVKNHYVQNIDVEAFHNNQNHHSVESESSITHRVITKTPSPLNEGTKSTTYNTQVNFLKDYTNNNTI